MLFKAAAQPNRTIALSADRPSSLLSKDRVIASSLIVVMIGLYVSTLTKNYHGDPIYYVMVAEGLHKNTFFPPDHLLLPTVFRGWHKLWQVFGFEGRAIVSAQWLNAIVGSLTVGILWLTLQLA